MSTKVFVALALARSASSLSLPAVSRAANVAAASFSGSSSSSSLTTSRRHALGLAGVALLGLEALPAYAAEAESDPRSSPSCAKDCFRECDIVAPGNQQYCKTQCDDYCASGGPVGKDDVLRSDVTAAAPVAAGKGDCSNYKTDAAKAYCQKELAADNAAAGPPKEMNNGIFGDSGVSYSKGVEDLLATAFGATRQAKPLSEAKVDEFGGEVFDKAKAAFFSGN